MYRVKPLFDRVLLERCLSTEYVEEIDESTGDVVYKTKQGIIVAADQVEKHPEFRVVAIGPDFGMDLATGVKFKSKLKVGDIVLLGELSGVLYHDQMVVYAHEILARLEEMEPNETE